MPPTTGPAAALLAALALGCAAGPGAAPLSAQGTSRAAAFVEASLALSTLREDLVWMASGAALLGVKPPFSLGGAGTVVLGSRTLSGSTPGTDQELRMAFGGVVGQLELAQRDDRALWLRVLAGAGNAKLDLAVGRTQIASDNFGVVAPEVGATLRLRGPLRVGGALGYRTVFGVEDLPGLAPSDLRGLSVRLLVTVHRF